ncbi:MAG: chemotaxis protein CheW [Pirellulaceae bacterium]|nr:chemotaxis protein CheW [Planctomycetales bacterium]
MTSKQSYCTFHLDDLYFGIAVSQVQEVIRHQQMTRVPLAPPVVRGLMNLRGQIVTALDLRRRLGLPDANGERPPMNVVVRTSDGSVSLLVDRIGDVLETDEADFELPPETLRGVHRELIRGAFKLQGRLLLILDTERVVDQAA